MRVGRTCEEDDIIMTVTDWKKKNNGLVYYAHPINLYDTEMEERLETKIKTWFDKEVLNPNTPEHQKGYNQWKKVFGNGMLYFTEEVLPYCNSLVATAFPEGTFGAEVVKEFDYVKKHGGECYLLYPSVRTLVSAKSIPESRKLTIPETRDRVHNFDYFNNYIKK